MGVLPPNFVFYRKIYGVVHFFLSDIFFFVMRAVGHFYGARGFSSADVYVVFYEMTSAFGAGAFGTLTFFWINITTVYVIEIPG